MSHKFLSHRSRQRASQVAMFALFLILLGLTSVFLIPQVAHGTGAAGSGGGAAGGSGGASSTNGWGWYRFPVDGSIRPVGFRQLPAGQTSATQAWNNVIQTCRNINAGTIIAFVVNKADGYSGGNYYLNQGVVYNYPSSWYPFQHYYNGRTSSGNYLSIEDAHSDFNNSGVSGYTWGSDVGWFCYDFQAQPYTLSATSTADHTTAKPGDTINWTHVLKNDGPGATTQNTHSNVGMSGFTNGWGNPGLEYSPADTPAGAGVGNIRTSFAYNVYGVQQADVGNTLCEWVQYDPIDSQGDRNGRGPHACVSIPFGYTLTPTVSVDMIGAVEPGSTVNVTPRVNNTGPTKSQSTQWQVTQIVVAPGQAVPNAAGGTSPAAIAPCGTYFQALPNATCSTVKSGTSVFDTSGNVLSGDPLTTYPVIVGDLAIGTKICFAFSVQPSSNSSDVWTHSAPTCLIIGRKPKLQILGGDLMSAGGVNTSTTTKNIGGTNYTFGSWIEYGIFAIKTITGAGSGSAYAGNGLANANNCNTSQLSFTNSGSGTCSPGTPIGGYANSASIPDVSSSFPAAGAPVFSGGDLTAQPSGVYTGSGTIDISGGNIGEGKWFVLNAPGATVNIKGNITYFGGSMTSISDIPQVIIIAGNINITGGVTQVDSWLIASGGLNTCSDVAVGAPLSSDICNQALTVNGPVMAGQLYMYRTAGSGAGAAHSGDPAETFNLRPDAYLWASLRSADPNRIQTVYSTELPPRL